MPWKDPEKRREYNRRKARAYRANHPEDNRRRCREDRAKHYEKRIAGHRRWRAENVFLSKAHDLVGKAKRRAREAGVAFELNARDIAARIEHGACEVTGLPFQLSRGKPSPWSPSLDRRDPRAGYTLSNTRLVVFIYNLAKNEFEDADVLLLAQAISASTESAEKIVPAISSALARNK